MRRSIIVATVLLTAFVTQATAQTAQQWSVQGSLLGASFKGDENFEGVNFEVGYGAEFQLRYNPSTFSVGAGFQYTSHDVTFDNAGGADNVTVTFSGLFVEPRYVIFIGSEKAAPYLSARIMRLVATLSAPGFGDYDFDAWGYNVGGGLLVRLTDRMNLDVGVTAGGVTFVYEDADNETGSGVVGRLGIAVGI